MKMNLCVATYPRTGLAKFLGVACPNCLKISNKFISAPFHILKSSEIKSWCFP